jgi:hypothetical protein
MDCAKAQTNLYVLAPPTQCAHKAPPFLAEIIKRRGLLPYAEIVLIDSFFLFIISDKTF